jgi:hypothetical protein
MASKRTLHAWFQSKGSLFETVFFQRLSDIEP